MAKGSLFVVSTPIGNLQDITLRALRVLKEARIIAAEDTRHTRKLLSHFGINTPLTSCFEHNEEAKAGEIIKALLSGADVALVSDAGTPGISDPGFRLISLAIKNSIQVVPVPGPSAITAALSVAGFSLSSFTFMGFAPRGGSQRKGFLSSLKTPEHTYVMYERAGRLSALLSDIRGLYGDIDCVVAREVTKAHEEFIRGTVGDVIGLIRDKDIKGEATLIVRTRAKEMDMGSAYAELERLLMEGSTLRDAVREVSSAFSIPKPVVYKEALKANDAIKRIGQAKG